jgi:hypothetical protein
MQSFKDFLTEAKIETGIEFAFEIEKAIRKSFPKSTVQAKFTEMIQPSIMVRFAMRREFSNSIIQNDPAFMLFNVRGGFTDDGSIVPDFKHVADLIQGGSLFVPGSALGGKVVKFGWRKKTGDVVTIIKHFEAYFKKVKKVLDANPDLISDLRNP